MVKQPVIHAFTLPCAPGARCVLQNRVCRCVSLCCTAGVSKKNKKRQQKKKNSGAALLIPERARALWRAECDVQLWRSHTEAHQVCLLWQQQPAVESKPGRGEGLAAASVPDSVSNNSVSHKSALPHYPKEKVNGLHFYTALSGTQSAL